MVTFEEDVNLKVLWPKENRQGQKIKNLNHDSIVLKLNYKNNSWLLTGDAEMPVEEKMLEIFNSEEFEAEVLKVGHHGSSDSTSQEFLEAVKPTWVVISVGVDNTYGHPSLRVIRRLERLGAKILRTDELGDIMMISDGENVEYISSDGY